MDSKYIESSTRDFFAKLEQLSHLVGSMKEEELSIREDLDQSCSELKTDVGLMEERQQKIQDLLRSTYLDRNK